MGVKEDAIYILKGWIDPEYVNYEKYFPFVDGYNKAIKDVIALLESDDERIAKIRKEIEEDEQHKADKGRTS